MNKKLLSATSCVSVALVLSGCVTASDGSGMPSFGAGEGNGNGGCTYNSAMFVAGGAVIGASLAYLLTGDKKTAAIAGGVAGGLAGKAVQAYLTDRCQKIEEAKAKMKSTVLTSQAIFVESSWAKNPNSGAQDAKEAGYLVTLSNKSMFSVGGAALSPEAEYDMRNTARAYKGTGRKVVIVGHTDASGGAESNQVLSEKRAKTVAKIFEQEGVDRANLYYKGAGENRPAFTNATAKGRADNRRVEVIELQSESGVIAFDQKLEANPKYLANAAPRKSNVELKTDSTIPPPPPAPSEAKVVKTGTLYDFGGRQVDGSGADMVAAVGKKQEEGGLLSSLSFISTAHASDDMGALLNTACIADEYRNVAAIKSLETGEQISESHESGDFMPGLYGTTWSETLNNNLVGMARVAVLRDGGQSGINPETFIFKNYKQGDQKPTLKTQGRVRSYIGENGVLYRVFFSQQAWPLRCADVVFSRKNPETVSTGKLYYDKGGKVYAADYSPKFAKQK